MEHQYNQWFWTHKNARFWPPFCNSHRWWQHRVLSDSTTHCSNVYFWNIFSCGVQNMSNSIFLEFFLWLCLLIKAHGNNMSCDVVKRGRSCYFHEWNLHIWNYLFLPLFYHVCLNWHLFYMCGYFWILCPPHCMELCSRAKGWSMHAGDQAGTLEVKQNEWIGNIPNTSLISPCFFRLKFFSG